MNIVYLSLGSNIGDRISNFRTALSLLSTNCGNIVTKSKVYETSAWGITDQPNFLNMAIKIETAFEPIELLKKTTEIETQLGRQREVKWGNRTLDIDILFYNDMLLNSSDLVIPHNHLHERLFTLIPLAEISPALIHPVFICTISELLNKCTDKLEVKLSNEQI